MTKTINFTTEFEKFINISNSGRRLTASGKKIRKGTISQYRCVLKLVTEFECHNNQIIRLALLHRVSFSEFKKETKYWEKFNRDFSTFLYKNKKCYDNYVLGVYRVIKTFFQYLTKEKSFPVGEFHKKFKVPAESFMPAVIMPWQLRFLISNKEFENGLSYSQKRVKDIFVFGCTVGLRYKDLMNLRVSNLQIINGEHIIIINTQKTGSEVRLILPEYAISILEKYKKKNGQYLLPRLSSTNFNLQIKLLIKNAGWNYFMPKIRHRYGKASEIKNKHGESWKFYQHITAHTMRRTAITVLLMMGLGENIVRRISGHAPGSKEFYKYVVLSNEYLNDNLKIAYEKLVTS